MSDDEMTTQPTIDTLIAHIDRWGAKFSNELSELRQGQEEFRTGQTELRQSVDELRKGQDELRKGQDELRKGQDELRKGQEQLRTDLNAGLRRVERKIEILNDNFLSIKADIRDLEVRMEKLESESLARS
jgi:uncharacterized coiled-coil DUF342 family protein